MKKSIALLLLMSSLSVASQEIPQDSLSVTLDEVHVQATPVIRKADKSIYTVQASLKERSASTLDLLKNIMIPELTVNEVMQQVSSSLGTVQIRINGREADVEKLKTVNRNDIVKVEWIDNPGLRYGPGVGAVVNIIVQNPTVGGSVSVDVMEAFTAAFNNSSANLTLNHGRSQWQAGTSANIRNNMQMFRKYSDSYLLPDGSLLQRTQQPLDGYFDQTSINPYVSYNYLRPDTTNFYVGFNVWDRLRDDALFDGIVESNLSRNGERQRLIDRTFSPRYIMPSVYLYYEQQLSRKQTLILSSSVSYTTSSTTRSYIERDIESSINQVDIENNIKSNSWGYYFEGNYIKNWEKAGQLTTGLRLNYNDVKSTYLDYGRQTVEQHLTRLYFYGEYSVPVGKVMLTAGAGGQWNQSRIAGVSTESTLDFMPKLTVNWRAGDKSRWTFLYANTVNAPTATQLSPVTQAIDGIQIERGNPDLKSYVQHYMRLRYGFSNNKNFNLSAYTFYSHTANPIFKYYTWEGDYILRSYDNEGVHNIFSADVSLSWQPIPDWLSLQAEVKYIRYHSRGKGFRHTINTWMQSFGFAAYHWNWSLGFEFNNPAEELYGEDLGRGERFNVISLGYQWKNWNFQAMMFMPFGTYSQSEKVIGRLVNQSTELRSRTVQRMPLIRVSYNFNWGHQKRGGQRKLSGGTADAQGATAAGR